MAGSDDGLDYRQPHGMQAPESYTTKVIKAVFTLNLIIYSTEV